MFHKQCEPEDSEVILQSSLVELGGGGKPKWELCMDPNEGRYLKASDEIKPGETIFTERPINKSPIYSTAPVCLGCYKSLTRERIVACTGCGWPLCSKKCQKSDEHFRECQLFQSKRLMVDAKEFNFEGVEPMYDVIGPLRVLLQKESEVQKWKMFWKLMSHVDDWKSSEGWKHEHRKVVDYILNTLKIDGVDEDAILTIFGIFYTNDFSVRVVDGDGCSRIRLCYPLSSMCSHDCAPNTFRCILSSHQDFLMVVKASKTIKKGEKILFTYLDLLLPTLVRNSILQRDKKFSCHCKRCQDPREFGTDGSGLVCEVCNQGYKIDLSMSDTSVSLIKKSASEGGIWKCDTCGQEKDEKQVKALFVKVHEEADLLIHTTPDANSVQRFEAFLTKYEGKILHPNHMSLVNIKYSLAGFYGRLPGYEMNQMTEKMLERKRQICEETLRVLNKIDPGISPLKGIIMYEIHMPIILLSKLKLHRLGRQYEIEAKKEFQKGLLYLKMSLELLKYVHEGTFEHKLYVNSKDSVSYLEEFISKM